MPPTSEQQNTVSPQISVPSSKAPSTIIKVIRIFLLVLIVIGLGLIATEKLWVPRLVNVIVPPVVPIVITSVSQPSAPQQRFQWVPFSSLPSNSEYSESMGKIYFDDAFNPDTGALDEKVAFPNADLNTFVFAVNASGTPIGYEKDST